MQSKRLKILKTLTIAMTCISLLTSCSGWFKPRTMTIEYDEEVKLHDGSMIWVHITRHYFYTSEPSHGGAYMPSDVEISWDTGFEGVGRKSVYFDESLTIINKFKGKWYLIGRISPKNAQLINSVNCGSVGIQVMQVCIVAVNEKGHFIKPDLEDVYQVNRMNILHPFGIKDWGLFPQNLNGKTITWEEKLSLEKTQSSDYHRLEKAIQILSNMENGHE